MLPKKCPACIQNTLSHDDDYIFCTNCPIYRNPLNFLQKPLVWASHEAWWWRLPIFAWFIALLIQNIRDSSFALSRLGNPFSALDFGIHELGHFLFSPFGDFMRILGGSLFQCLFPIFWLIGCIQRRWYFAASLSLCWLGLNLFDVATYAADAKARLLPLSIGLGVFGVDPNETDAVYDSSHDWYQLLTRTDHLDSALSIADGLRMAAAIIFVVGLLLAGILLWRMIFYRFRSASEHATDSKNTH